MKINGLWRNGPNGLIREMREFHADASITPALYCEIQENGVCRAELVSAEYITLSLLAPGTRRKIAKMIREGNKRNWPTLVACVEDHFYPVRCSDTSGRS